MALYAIGDLHLSIGTGKSMEVFGGRWMDYMEKIKAGFAQVVRPEDTVVLCGDVAWGMTLEQAASLAVEFVLACIDATARDPQAGWYGVEFDKALPLLCDRVRELPEN